jgi:hypothetical protein
VLIAVCATAIELIGVMSVFQASSLMLKCQTMGFQSSLLSLGEERKGVSERDIPQAAARHSKNDAVLYMYRVPVMTSDHAFNMRTTVRRVRYYWSHVLLPTMMPKPSGPVYTRG